MSYSYSIDKTNGVVFTVWDGVLNIETFMSLQNALREEPEFEPSYSVLTDLRGVTDSDLTSSDMMVIANNSPFDGSGRRAFLVGSALMRGMSRMYSAYKDPGNGQIKQFHDMAAARAWLGLPPEES